MIWIRCLLMLGELSRSWVGRVGGALETWSGTRGILKRIIESKIKYRH